MKEVNLRTLLNRGTNRPWSIPMANVFRVIAPEVGPSVHEAYMQGRAGNPPPYPWKVVVDVPFEDGNVFDAELIAEGINALPKLLDADDALSELFALIEWVERTEPNRPVSELLTSGHRARIRKLLE